MNTFQSYPEHSPAQLSPQSKFQFRETKDKSFGAARNLFSLQPAAAAQVKYPSFYKVWGAKEAGGGRGLIYYTSTTTASPQP